MPPCFHSVFRYIQPQSSQPLHFMKKIHCQLFILLALFLSPLLKMQASFSVFLWLFLILSITRQPCKQKSMVEYTHKAWRGGVTGYCRDPASHTHIHTHTHTHTRTHTQKHTASFLIFSSVSPKQNKKCRQQTIKECDVLAIICTYNKRNHLRLTSQFAPLTPNSPSPETITANQSHSPINQHFCLRYHSNHVFHTN